jgi:molybdate transport system regulatory protein
LRYSRAGTTLGGAVHGGKRKVQGAGEPDDVPAAAPGIRLTGRLWIERDGETLLSGGRVELMERIRATGSISAAARSMGMGYRHAWELIEDMNRRSARPLIERSAGGARGGGTRLTPEGEDALARFHALVARFRRLLETETGTFVELFGEPDRPSTRGE